MVYPTSTRDEAQFPSIGSRANLHSTSCMTSGYTCSGHLQNFPETLVSSLEEHQFQHRKSRKGLCIPNCLEMRADSLVGLKRYANFAQAPQEEASLSNSYVRGTVSLLSQVEWTTRCPDSKGGLISLQCLEYRLIFHLTR